MRLLHKSKSNTTRILSRKCGGYMELRLLHLIRGDLWGTHQEMYPMPKGMAEPTEVSLGHST